MNTFFRYIGSRYVPGGIVEATGHMQNNPRSGWSAASVRYPVNGVFQTFWAEEGDLVPCKRPANWLDAPIVTEPVAPTVVTSTTPDDELIHKILITLGVDPGDWAISLSGIYAAIRSNMQIGEPHMSKVEDWTDATEISENTLTAVMFKLVERAEKAERLLAESHERYAHEGGKPQIMTVDILKRWVASIDVPIMTDIYQTNVPNVFYATFALRLWPEHFTQLKALNIEVIDPNIDLRNRYMLKWLTPKNDEFC